MAQIIISNSFEETQKLGSDFVKQLKGINVLALYGDLGSGKTTFVQGLANGLGIQKKIISPTFIIMRTYTVSINHQSLNINHFYHVDLYRIETENGFKELGLLELMKDSHNFFAIEWPEKIERSLPKKRINLSFEYIDENRRKIIIDKKISQTLNCVSF